VLCCLVEGFANKEIAARMDISASVVKYTLQQLFARTGVRSRAQLVKVALENYRDLLSAAEPGRSLATQSLPTAAPWRGLTASVPSGAESQYAAVHQAVYRAVRSVAYLPVSRTGRYRVPQRAAGAKRAAAAGGI
jgi:hypothetical protein